MSNTEPETLAVSPAEVTHRFVQVNGIRIHLAEKGDGPLIILCHGFPEFWYSWRFQFDALCQAGYHVVAPDLRGYGQTDQPAEVEQYTMLHLVGDLVGILDALEERQAILVGHDWGSVLAWHAGLLRPDRFPRLVTLSSPYLPRGPLYGPRAGLPPTQVWKLAFGDTFFYQSALVEPGRAEAELDVDIRTILRRFLYGGSGDASPDVRWHPILPDPKASLLNTAGNPASLPAWLTEEDLDVYAAEFSRTGFRGGLAWYRCIDRNWELLAAYSGARLTQPALFLWGDADPLLEIAGMQKGIQRQPDFVPGLKQFSLSGCGHWIQQERAQEVNAAILDFLAENRS
jgi:pimeloyl-ACP methyl ester carboxylesterase